MMPDDTPPDYKALYEELIFAVGDAYPGETRHATALRYIQEREARPAGGPCKAETV